MFRDSEWQPATDLINVSCIFRDDHWRARGLLLLRSVEDVINRTQFRQPTVTNTIRRLLYHSLQGDILAKEF